MQGTENRPHPTAAPLSSASCAHPVGSPRRQVHMGSPAPMACRATGCGCGEGSHPCFCCGGWHPSVVWCFCLLQLPAALLPHMLAVKQAPATGLHPCAAC